MLRLLVWRARISRKRLDLIMPARSGWFWKRTAGGVQTVVNEPHPCGFGCIAMFRRLQYSERQLLRPEEGKTATTPQRLGEGPRSVLVWKGGCHFVAGCYLTRIPALQREPPSNF